MSRSYGILNMVSFPLLSFDNLLQVYIANAVRLNRTLKEDFLSWSKNVLREVIRKVFLN